MPSVTRSVAWAAAPSQTSAFGRVAVGVPPRLEVVAGPDRVEPGALGGDREVEQASGRELLRRRLVAEPQRHRVVGP